MEDKNNKEGQVTKPSEEKIFRVGENEAYEVLMKWMYENGFWLTSGVDRMEKVIAHWLLMSTAVQGNSVFGDIVECGVFKGASLIQFATFRKFLGAENTRKVIAFDAFGSFQSEPSGMDGDDQDFITTFKAEAGDGISIPELNRVFEYKGFPNTEFIQGDVMETLPEYRKKNPALRIALLHVDVDTYKATYCCLENLYPLVSRNGVIILDDYGKVRGATRAIDDYFRCNKIQIGIRQMPFAKIAFCIKG